jgi:ABC-type phosphate transport system permease subunit
LNCCVKRVIKMLLIVYLCGCLVTMIGVLVAASRFGDRRVSQSLRELLAVLAGVPVLVVGVVELIAIVVLAQTSARIRPAAGPVWSQPAD